MCLRGMASHKKAFCMLLRRFETSFARALKAFPARKAIYLAAAFFTCSAYGNVIYSYTGNVLQCGVEVDSPDCRAGGHLSGSITLAGPLGADLPLTDITSQVLSGTFTDDGAFGNVLSTNYETHDYFAIGTDDSGNINTWEVGFDNLGILPVAPYENIATVRFLGAQAFSQDGSDYNPDGTDQNAEGALLQYNPGTWTCTSGCPSEPSPVSEPGAYGAIPVGLALLALYRQRMAPRRLLAHPVQLILDPIESSIQRRMSCLRRQSGFNTLTHLGGHGRLRQ